MHAYTAAIGVFEAKIVEIKLAYRLTAANSGEISLKVIEERDEVLDQCLWAIELLHSAYIDEKLQPVTTEIGAKALHLTI